MDSIICQAIASKLLLEFIYDGQVRVVEPHTYGLNNAGHIVLSAYQVRGGSNTTVIPGWGLFKEKKIHGMSLIQKNFIGARPEYKKADSRMIIIFNEL